MDEELIQKEKKRKILSTAGIIFSLVAFFLMLVDPLHFEKTSPQLLAILVILFFFIALACWVASVIMKIRLSSMRSKTSTSEEQNSTQHRSKSLEHLIGGFSCFVFALLLFLVISWQLRTNTYRNWVTFELLFVGGGVITGISLWIQALLRLIKHSRSKK